MERSEEQAESIDKKFWQQPIWAQVSCRAGNSRLWNRDLMVPGRTRKAMHQECPHGPSPEARSDHSQRSMVRDRKQLRDRASWKNTSFRNSVWEREEKQPLYLWGFNSSFLEANERDRDSKLQGVGCAGKQAERQPGVSTYGDPENVTWSSVAV